MSIKKKVVWLPYDMDTAIGINNEGELVFGYELEDIDHQQGGANIFNGQDSVIWKNIRAAFSKELASMYSSLRASGALSYELVEQMFEAHQSVWSEAIFNEDSRFKYIDPFVLNNINYLGMLLGSKAEQRKWWLYNRFRYLDSKYIAGDAKTDTITLRPYAAADIFITPYADIYATVAWDSNVVPKRCPRNTTARIECPYQTMNDNVVTIYSASQLASIGDVSGLQVGLVDISRATRLQSLKIGDSSSSYDNINLRSLTLGNNVLLQTLDARNCSGLGDTTIQGHTQTTVDISGCGIIENVYFEGTKIQGITLPNGGVLKKLHLPATITNLTVRNQSGITDFSMPSYQNISTLRVENCGSAIPVLDILDDIPANSRVRILGFELTVTSTDDVEDFFDYLDTMRGLDENGNNLENAVVSGDILGLDTVTGAWMAAMRARGYTDVNIHYNHVVSTLTYMTYDGSQLVETETISDGGNGTKTNNIPRSADARYTYTPNGWSRVPNGSPDANAIVSIVEDRTVYAAYDAVGQKYTVRFYNGTTLLQTVNNVLYGGTAQYTGSTPVHTSDPENYEFYGWSPSNVNIEGNTDCYAQYRFTGVVARKLIDRTISGAYSNNRVTSIGNYVFNGCSALTAADFPAATSIANYVFYNCINLITINFPVATSIGGNAFYYCSNLTTINFPVATSIGGNAFQLCKSLTTADFPAVTTIGGSAFYGCTSLTTLILRNTQQVVTLSNTNAFRGANNCIIYVPDALVENYKAASNWSTYADRIKGLSELPTE